MTNKSLIRNVGFPAVLLLAIAASAATLSCQMTTSRRPSFKEASIKPNDSAGEIPGPWAETSDYFAWNGRTLKTLMMVAYGVRDWQIQGGPDWVGSQPWDVEASVEPPAEAAAPEPVDRNKQHAAMLLRLQSLLEDRFKLKIQRQAKPSPVYNLIVAEGGPKIMLDEDQNPPTYPEPGTKPSLRMLPQVPRGSMRMGSGKAGNSIDGRAVSMADFIAQCLLSRSDRPIIDRTNLKGLYTIKMRWPAEDSISGGSSGPSLPMVTENARFSPGFFAAMQEQLGLQLVSAKAPVELLVITSAEKPSDK